MAQSSTPEPPNAKTSSPGGLWKMWTLGVLLTTALAWLLGHMTMDHILVWEYAPTVGRYVVPAGTVHTHRNEGHAASVYGRFGLIGIPDVTQISGTKMAIWGDSFVEALQVPDNEKMHVQLTRICRENFGVELTGVAVAESAWGVPDYIEQLPAYERLVDPAAHAFMLAQMKDICPDGKLFLDSPVLQLSSRGSRSDKELAARRLFARWKMGFVFLPLKRTAAGLMRGNSLRFLPGQATLPQEDPASQQCVRGFSEPPLDAWRFLLSALKMTTSKPLIFVYLPSVPRLDNGRVNYADACRDWVDEFAALCRQENVLFVDLTHDFVATHRERGRFVRGFQNLSPTKGHLNALGHEVVARALCRTIAERNDAF